MLADEKSERRQPHIFILMLAAIGALALVAVAFLVFVVVLVATQVSHVTSRFDEGRGGYLPLGGNEKIVAGIRFDTEVTTEAADEVLAMLEEARSDDRVAGVLLDVNSPGGSVVASQEIYDAISDLRESLPVVTYVREMAASGAYYAAAASSRIIANRGSMVGSIGVILSSLETTELMKWLKVRPVTLKTGELKDAGSPVREWTERDKAYLQKLINDTRDQFVNDVKEKRALTPETIEKMSDGRVVLGAEAVELKLADELGSRQDAVDAVAELAGLKETPELIYMERPLTISESMREFLGQESLSKEIRRAVGEALERASRPTLPSRR